MRTYSDRLENGSREKGIAMPEKGEALLAEYNYVPYLDQASKASCALGGFTEVAGLSATRKIASYRLGNSPVGHPIRLKNVILVPCAVPDLGSKASAIRQSRTWFFPPRAFPSSHRGDTVLRRNARGARAWSQAELPTESSAFNGSGHGTR